MTATRIITLVDRVALGLINTLVVIGLPLVAVGLLTQAL
jgi:hypothetical protein